MTKTPAMIEKSIRLSPSQVERLSRLAEAHRLSEDEIVAQALDLLFSRHDILDAPAERQHWSSLSDDAFGRVWDNEEDAAYDNWRALYGA